MHAVVGGQAARRHAEFLQRVGERERHVQVVVGIVVHGAVKDVRDAGAQPAGHRDRHRIGSAALAADLARVHGGARQDDQVRDLAPLQRQLHDPLVLDHLRDAGALHVDERRRGFDRDGLLDVADRKHGIDGGRGADLQHDAGLHVGAEARQRDLEPVGAESAGSE